MIVHALDILRQVRPAHAPAKLAAMSRTAILVVDDDDAVRRSVRAALPGRAVFEAASKGAALTAFRAQRPALVLLDVSLPDGDGLDLLEAMQCLSPNVHVIVITGTTEVDVAVRALRLGALDFLTKPFSAGALTGAVARAERHLNLVEDEQGIAGLVGESPALRSALDRIRQVAAFPCATVVLLGESGTGKELAARAVHLFSSRADGPFVAVNCAAVAETLLESELFGYERGAFTGARTEGKRGLFEAASGGTIFLDEIAETAPSFQASLLRVLEQRTIRPVGGIAERPVDVRVVAATHRDLVGEVLAGRFREDLFFRVHVVPIVMPPLRERSCDIEPLARHFLERMLVARGDRPTGFSAAALAALRAHPWPGNVRELRNVVERAAILAGPREIAVEHLELELTTRLSARSTGAGAAGSLTLRSLRLDELERQVIERAMAVAQGNKSRAAELLGITRTTLYSKLQALPVDGREGDA